MYYAMKSLLLYPQNKKAQVLVISISHIGGDLLLLTVSPVLKHSLNITAELVVHFTYFHR